jgi:hypothetical protein
MSNILWWITCLDVAAMLTIKLVCTCPAAMVGADKHRIPLCPSDSPQAVHPTAPCISFLTCLQTNSTSYGSALHTAARHAGDRPCGMDLLKEVGAHFRRT